MASKIYAKGLVNILETARHLEEAGMKVILVDGTVTFNTAHDFLDDVSAGIVDGTAAIALTNPAVTESAGVITFDADDTGLTWSSVTDANDVGAAIVYNDTGCPMSLNKTNLKRSDQSSKNQRKARNGSGNLCTSWKRMKWEAGECGV